jgi:hypothetical protein
MWVKSTHSNPTGSCLEWWVKSWHSNPNGECVEWRKPGPCPCQGRNPLIRDSVLGDASPILRPSRAAWRGLVVKVKNGWQPELAA